MTDGHDVAEQLRQLGFRSGRDELDALLRRIQTQENHANPNAGGAVRSGAQMQGDHQLAETGPVRFRWRIQRPGPV